MSVPLIKNLIAILFFSFLYSNAYAVKADKIDNPPTSTLRTKVEQGLQKNMTKKRFTKIDNKRKAKKAKRKAERKDPILKWRRFAIDFFITGLIVFLVGQVIGIAILSTNLITTTLGFIGLLTWGLSLIIASILGLISIVCLITWLIKKNK